MKILISWTGLTGYTGGCWRALAALPAVRIRAYVEPTALDQDFRAERELAGLDYRMLAPGRAPDPSVAEEVLAFAPDVMLIVGWRATSCRWFATHPKWRQVRKILVCDMPFQWRLRKFAARFVLARYLRNFSAAYVPGRSAARYMRWLGFGGRRPVRTGLFATDLARFEAPGGRGGDRPEPRFLYVGRYSEEKGLDCLLKAYRIYRERVDAPWGLDCVGSGARADWLRNQDGVRDLGFVPPERLAEVYASHEALVLASVFEPWGLVLVEAAGAGVPIICTAACGAAGEVVRENGFVVETGDAEAFAAAMERLHRLSPEARTAMGERGRAWAAPYDCRAWARRTLRMCEELTGRADDA